MKLLYLSNYLNHHQRSLADAFYQLLGDDYHFIATRGVPNFRKELGYQENTAPYLLFYNEKTSSDIDKMIIEADVVIYGCFPIKSIIPRLKSGKTTFTDDECRYRSLLHYLKWPIYTYRSYYLNKGYFLFASAYGPIDYFLSGMNPKKCFQWGYWPEVKRYPELDELIKKKELRNQNIISILWAGRLIKLKHPEAVVYVAEKLKKEGYQFEVNIIGSGKLENRIRNLIESKNLLDVVHMQGSMTAMEVRSNMEASDIFLFTSDRNEGWGAVLNEAMNSCCAVVGSNNIGSVPSIIEDGKNGFIFKDKDWKDLYIKVKWLIDHPRERQEMGKNAYKTMSEIWNGENAADCFLKLYTALINGQKPNIQKGPCSPAPIIMRRWKGRLKCF